MEGSAIIAKTSQPSGEDKVKIVVEISSILDQFFFRDRRFDQVPPPHLKAKFEYA